jgi:hypothetical protein
MEWTPQPASLFRGKIMRINPFFSCHEDSRRYVWYSFVLRIFNLAAISLCKTIHPSLIRLRFYKCELQNHALMGPSRKYQCNAC